MRPLDIAFIGNFKRQFQTEVHWAASLEALGHRVRRLQEEDTSDTEIYAVGRQVDLTIYCKTRGFAGDGARCFAALHAEGHPTASLHLDLYVGLRRERAIPRDPFWSTKYVFTADGDPKSQVRFTQLGINHHWLRAAVFAPECVNGTYRESMASDVAFVGAVQRYHAEWPYRGRLVSFLRRMYGNQFRVWPGLGPVIRDGDLNDLYASVKVVVGDSLCPGFNHKGYWCVDDQTEILTNEGWKDHSQVAVGDLAYGIEPDSGMGRWSVVTAVNVFDPIERPMLSIEGPGHSSLTTMNHRWIVEQRRLVRDSAGAASCPECGYVSPTDSPRAIGIHRSHAHGVSANGPSYHSERRLTFKRSSELRGSDGLILAAPSVDLPSFPKYEDAFVELVAWAWTEGTQRADGGYVGISQSNAVNLPYVERIRACLTALYGGPSDGLRGSGAVAAWREDVGGHGMTIFGLNKVISDDLKRICPGKVVDCAFVAQLTAAQLRLFLEASIDADGCRKKNGGDTIAQKDPDGLDAVQMAAALLGIATNRTWVDGSIWVLTLEKRTRCQPLRKDARKTRTREVVHDGLVWCPTTETGTWLARRGGSVYFTGNSDRVYETVGRGGFLIHPMISGLDAEFINGEHLALYRYGDFRGLKSLIDSYLNYPEERARIAAQGQAMVREKCNYKVRMAEMLDVISKAEGWI